MANPDVVDLDTVDPIKALDIDGPMPADVARVLALRARAQRITGRPMTVAEAEARYVTDRATRTKTE